MSDQVLIFLICMIGFVSVIALYAWVMVKAMELESKERETNSTGETE